ncbi:dienelactone hydrolase family protein [bacterium]|nr:MAG: dienelactone hydrolase family protein [bacterium]
MRLSHLLVMSFFLFISCQPKKTDTSKTKIASEEVTYSADSVNMKGYVAWDASKQGKRPGVLVVHEWWGHNPYARHRAEMLAELGYVALAVDMYGDGKVADHPKDAGMFAGEVMKRGPGATARFMKAMEILKSNPHVDGSNIAAIGYCFGGSTVLNMARQGLDLKAVVSFHGGLSTGTPAKKGEVKAKLLVCNGGADKFVPQTDINAFKKEMDDVGVTYTFKSYEGALHGFTNPAADSLAKKFDMAIAYNAAADSASWADMKVFFGEILK